MALLLIAHQSFSQEGGIYYLFSQLSVGPLIPVVFLNFLTYYNLCIELALVAKCHYLTSNISEFQDPILSLSPFL